MAVPGNLLPADDATFEGASTAWVCATGPLLTPTTSVPLAIQTDVFYEGAQSAGLDAPAIPPISPTPRFASPMVAAPSVGSQVMAGVALRWTSPSAGLGNVDLWLAVETAGGATLYSLDWDYAIAKDTWTLLSGTLTIPAGAIGVGLVVTVPTLSRTGLEFRIDEAFILSVSTAQGSFAATGSATPMPGQPALAEESFVVTGEVDALITAKAEAQGDLDVSSSARALIPDTPTARLMPATWIEAAVGLPSTQEPNRHDWVRLDVDGNCVRSIEWEEGRQKSLDDIEPATATVLLADQVGRLDPSNPQSELWQGTGPGVDFRTRIRVRQFDQDPTTYVELAATYATYADMASSFASYGVMPSAVEAVPFAGFVTRLEPDYELDDATVRIEAEDWQGILAEYDLPTSALAADLLISQAGVRHLWPMTTPSTSLFDEVAEADGSWTDATATTDSIAPFDPSPSTLITAGLPTGEITGLDVSGSWAISMWYRYAGEGGDGGAPLLRLDTAAGTDGILVTIGGTLYDYGAADSFAIASGGTLPDGGVLLEVWCDNGRIRARRNRGSFASGVDGPTRTFTKITVGGDIAGLSTTFAASWLAVLDPAQWISAAGGTLDEWELGTAPWVEGTGDRVARVTTLAGYPAEVEPGVSWPVCAPAALSGTYHEHVSRAAAGDRAVVSTTDTGQPSYRERPTVQDTPVVWFDSAARVGVPARDVRQVYGIDRFATDITVELGDGSTVNAQAPSKAPRSLRATTLLGAQDDALGLAGQILTERQTPRLLIPSLTLEGRDTRVPWPATQLRLGAVVGVIMRPPGRSAFAQVSIVERVRHQMDATNSWRIEIGLDRLVQYLTWQDVVDIYDDWAALIAAKATWADVLLAATPTPPGL